VIIWALLLVPALSGAVAFVIRPHGPRRVLLLAAAIAQAGLVARAWVAQPQASPEAWLAIDAPALLFMGISSGLFLAAAFYGVGYLRRESATRHADIEEGMIFVNVREATFTGCLLIFSATMTLVAVSRHLGLVWVAVEATTLSSAPLIHFHRQHRSLEATWKYILICSVGIAIALLGNFFLAVSASAAQAGGRHVEMTGESLAANAAALDPVWLKAAFLLLLVGYGTKMGLAPLHTWLPDAHSEAPSLVSALLSGALLNCAFLAILRVHAVLVAANLAAYAGGLLTAFGLISMIVAAVFILAQADYKRMLAYSSVEHMGILALGVGLGGAATFGAMFHAVNHSLAKAMLFLVAGNILAAWKTKSTSAVRGVGRVLPVSGVLWVAGFFAITGSPPFGTFVSELIILRGAIEGGHYVTAGLYLSALAAVFVGMAAIVLRMAYGRPGGQQLPDPAARVPAGHPLRAEPAWSWFAPAALGAVALLLGLWVPPAVREVLAQTAALLGGK
jgi:hydrogenase-4 component F